MSCLSTVGTWKSSNRRWKCCCNRSLFSPQSITPCQHKGSNLLFQVEANPETNGLRRLLAVKKSLAEFEQNVELVSKVSLFLFHYSSSSRSTLNAEAYVVTSGEMLFLDIQDLFGIGSLFSVSEKNTFLLHS